MPPSVSGVSATQPLGDTASVSPWDKAVALSSTPPSQVRGCPGTSVGTRTAAPRIILPSRSSVVLQMWWDPRSALKTWCKWHMAGTRQPWLAWPSRGQVRPLPSTSVAITVYLWLKKKLNRFLCYHFWLFCHLQTLHPTTVSLASTSPGHPCTHWCSLLSFPAS